MNAPVSLEQQFRKMMEEGTFPVQLSFYSLCLFPLMFKRSAAAIGYTQAGLGSFSSVPFPEQCLCRRRQNRGLVL